MITAACGVLAHLIEKDILNKTAITNVHIWNSAGFLALSTVVIISLIITNTNAANAETTVDGKRGYLISGYIDTHCHMISCLYLTTIHANSITTILDIGTSPVLAVIACRV
jgi:adenine deaminase